MDTDLKQLNVRVPAKTHDLLKKRAGRSHMSVQAYVSGLVEKDIDPSREAFVSGLVGDMTDLLDEFEDAFDVGNR
ncbi:hypothetical protein ACGFSB_28940 [Streptomyces sp. NPDC048441]|uniref:hypothetical protein n=1 Tax=Streptomyces sp. NPDC048441 TaxID=3365552 RepID=UPI003719C7F4